MEFAIDLKKYNFDEEKPEPVTLAQFTIPLSLGEVQLYRLNLVVISEKEVFLHLNSQDEDVVTVELTRPRVIVSIKYAA